MTPRQMVSTVLAAAVLIGASAGTADAARLHLRKYHRHYRHSGDGIHGQRPMSPERSSSRGASAQDTAVDRLNAQSLQRARAGTTPVAAQQGAMQTPMQGAGQ